jgi:hypothetical protein
VALSIEDFHFGLYSGQEERTEDLMEELANVLEED